MSVGRYIDIHFNYISQSVKLNINKNLSINQINLYMNRCEAIIQT